MPAPSQVKLVLGAICQDLALYVHLENSKNTAFAVLMPEDDDALRDTPDAMASFRRMLPWKENGMSFFARQLGCSVVPKLHRIV